MTPRKEVIGDATLYLGDCREILPTLGRFDLLCTDPPYGINHARDRHSEKWGWRDFPANGWDKERPSAETFALITAAAKHHIIWGGNYFTDLLPRGGKWLVWDKGQTDFSLADCELAWCSFDGAVRRILYARGRALQEGKVHPTQKPAEVMRWCIEQAPPAARVVDPFCGSGSTGVACALLGRIFVGVEAAPHFFDIACRRIEEAQRQGDLIRDVLPKAESKQEAFL